MTLDTNFPFLYTVFNLIIEKTLKITIVKFILCKLIYILQPPPMISTISTLGRIFRVKFQQTISNDFVFVEDIKNRIYDDNEKCKCLK